MAALLSFFSEKCDSPVSVNGTAILRGLASGGLVFESDRFLSMPMPNEENPPVPENRNRLRATLDGIGASLLALRTRPEGLPLGQLADRLGEAGFCFLAILLAVPFFQPISLGPLTMVSGGVFMIVGWQMGRGRHRVKLPAKMDNWHLRGNAWMKMLVFCRRILLWLSRFTRARLTGWVDGPQGARRVGWMIFVGGALLAIPFANLPLNNTFPALMIFFAALAWLERDGLMMLISLFWGVVTLVYFAVAGWLMFYFGAQIWQAARSFFGFGG